MAQACRNRTSVRSRHGAQGVLVEDADGHEASFLIDGHELAHGFLRAVEEDVARRKVALEPGRGVAARALAAGLPAAGARLELLDESVELALLAFVEDLADAGRDLLLHVFPQLLAVLLGSFAEA